MTCASPLMPSTASIASSSTRHVDVLPEPLGPTIITPWLSSWIWYTCIAFSIQLSLAT